MTDWIEDSIDPSTIQENMNYADFIQIKKYDENAEVERKWGAEWAPVTADNWDIVRKFWRNQTKVQRLRYRQVSLIEPNTKAIGKQIEESKDISPAIKGAVAQLQEKPLPPSIKDIFQESLFTPRLFWPSSTDPKGILLQYGTTHGQVYLLPYSATSPISSLHSFRLLQHTTTKRLLTSDPMVKEIQWILQPVIFPISDVVRTIQVHKPVLLTLMHQLTKDHVAVLELGNGSRFLWSVDILLFMYMNFFQEEALSPLTPFFLIAKRALDKVGLLHASLKERGQSHAVLSYIYWCYIYWQEECLNQPFSAGLDAFRPTDTMEELERIQSFIRKYIVNVFYNKHRIVDDTLLARHLSNFIPLTLPIEVFHNEETDRVEFTLEGMEMGWYSEWDPAKKTPVLRRNKTIPFSSNYLIRRLQQHFLLAGIPLDFIILEEGKVMVKHTRPPNEEQRIRFVFSQEDATLYIGSPHQTHYAVIRSTSTRRSSSLDPKTIVNQITRSELLELEQEVMHLKAEQQRQQDRNKGIDTELRSNERELDRLQNGISQQWQMFGYWRSAIDRHVKLLVERQQEREKQVTAFQETMAKWKSFRKIPVVKEDVIEYIQKQTTDFTSTLQKAEKDVEAAPVDTTNIRIREMAEGMTFMLNELATVVWQNVGLLEYAALGNANDPAIYSIVLIFGQMMDALTAMARINGLVVSLMSKKILIPTIVHALLKLQEVGSNLVYTIAELPEKIEVDWVELRYAITNKATKVQNVVASKATAVRNAILYIPRKAVEAIDRSQKYFLEKLPSLKQEITDSFPSMDFINPLTTQELSPTPSDLEKQIDVYALKTLSLISTGMWDVAETLKNGTILLNKKIVKGAEVVVNTTLAGATAAKEFAAWVANNAYKYTPLLLTNAKDLAIFMHQVEEEEAEEDMENLATWIPLFYKSIPSIDEYYEQHVKQQFFEKTEQIDEGAAWTAAQHGFSRFMSLVDVFQTFSVLIQTYFIAFKNQLPTQLPLHTLKKIVIPPGLRPKKIK